jgi:enoyl-CoA hydratase
MGLTISRRVAGPRCFRYNNGPTFATDIKGISMTNSLVLTESDDGVTVVTLNRPEALNALSRALRGAIVDTFERLRTDAATQVIILTGAGRAFTAGLDLKELGGERDADASGINDRDLLRVLDEVGRPMIGAINGYAITGGFEIALMCDFLIASTQAKFADTHARVGVVPGWGLSQRLPRLIGINRAKELSLTGNYLSAERAYEWGLVNRVVEPAELLPTCKALARDILTTDPATRSEIRRIMDQGWNATLGEGMAIEHDASRQHSRRELTPEKVAARRKGIQERGRSQSH